MSDSDDDIYAWDKESPAAEGDDGDNDRGGGTVSKGLDRSTGKRSARRSARSGKTLQYKDASSSEEDDGSGDDDDGADEESDEEVVIVEEKKPRKRSPSLAAAKMSPRSPKKKTPPSKPKSPKKSPVKVKGSASKKVDAINADDNDKVASASGSAKSEPSSGGGGGDPSDHDGGIDVIVPHSLLNKHQGSGKNECLTLVQVESNDDASHRLDFHGQSGAIGRFEADDEGGESCRADLCRGSAMSRARPSCLNQSWRASQSHFGFSHPRPQGIPISGDHTPRAHGHGRLHDARRQAQGRIHHGRVCDIGRRCPDGRHGQARRRGGGRSGRDVPVSGGEREREIEAREGSGWRGGGRGRRRRGEKGEEAGGGRCEGRQCPEKEEEGGGQRLNALWHLWRVSARNRCLAV
ncbi:hypothetical protein ACHAWF_009294 [Thalassiosira exigua]